MTTNKPHYKAVHDPSRTGRPWSVVRLGPPQSPSTWVAGRYKTEGKARLVAATLSKDAARSALQRGR